MLRIARDPANLQSEIQALLDAVDGGLLGADLVQQHGAELITHMLALWPSAEADPYDFRSGHADLLDYQPGKDWSKAGAHAPHERVVAALLRAGADPWKVDLIEKVEGIVQEEGTVPPAWYALLNSPVRLSSFSAFLRHPSCPTLDDLAKHRDSRGRPLIEIAAGEDVVALKMLLDLGLDPNTVGSKSLPVLFHAGYRGCVEALVEAGANTNLQSPNGNSLEMHWAIEHPGYAQEMIGALPKKSKHAPPIQVSLASLVANLDNARRSVVRSILVPMKNPAGYRWKVGGTEVDLLEVIISEALFGPIQPKLETLTELLNKNYTWRPESRRLFRLVEEVGKSSALSGTSAALRAAIDQKVAVVDIEGIKASIERILEVRLAVRPNSFALNQNLQRSDQSNIVYGWSDLLTRTARTYGDEHGVLLPIYQALQKSMEESGSTVSTSFPYLAFRSMENYVAAHDLPEKQWLFWTAMGVHSSALGSNKSWELWERTLPQHSPDWLNDPIVQRAIEKNQDQPLKARLDKIVLDRTSEPVVSGAPSRRF